MKKTNLRILIAFSFFLIIINVIGLSVSSQINEKSLDILIFVSPQYASDNDIIKSIEMYLSAIYNDIEWKGEIIKLNEKTNNYLEIDNTIESYFLSYQIKACIMVGEDIDTPLGGSNNNMKQPSIVPWATIGGEEAYEINENGVVCKEYKIQILISLIYPTSSLGFITKKTQIVNVFNKFSLDRNNKIYDEISVFESSDINKNSKEIYQKISTSYYENPSDNVIQNSLYESYSMFFVHGHSNPSGTDLNSENGGWFSTDFLDTLNTPLFGADGCYVNGWYTKSEKNSVLTPSIDNRWYGSQIFTSKHIKVMILGLLSNSFIENSIPELVNGITLAESLIGDTFFGEYAIIGDPTFHF